MHTRARSVVVAVAGLASAVALLWALFIVGAAVGPAYAQAPTPETSAETATTPNPTNPSEPESPSEAPTEPSANVTTPNPQPTAPTRTATPSPTPTATATPTPTPTHTPSPTPTAAPVQRPATPPAATSSAVPIWSLIIAIVVLAVAIPLLVRLSRTGEGPPAETGTTTTIHLDDGTDILLLMTEVGEAMIDSGYDVTSVQVAMDDVAAANGLRRAESIVLPTAVFVSARVGGQVRTGAVTTGHRPVRLHQIEELDEVVAMARRGLVAPREALGRIAYIRSLPSPYTPMVQLLGQVLTSAALAVLLGASWLGIVVSVPLGALVGAVFLAAARIPSRYHVLLTVAASFGVSLTVFLLSRTDLDFGVLPCVMAPLVLLLPGALLTTSVIELSTGQMISGAGRLAAGAMQLVLLALGIVAAAALVGIPALDLARAQSPLGPIGPWLAVAVFGLGVVLNKSARARSLGWILIVLYVAYGAQVIGNLLLGGVLSAFVGAAAMTPVAAVVARQRTGPPAMVSFTPAFWILVPGALGLVGVTTILAGDANGLQTLLTTAATMVAIALGVLVGWALTGLFRRLRARRRSEMPAGDAAG